MSLKKFDKQLSWEFLRDTVFWTLVGFCLFSLAPKMYFEYLDDTIYFDVIEVSIPGEKVFAPCEQVPIELFRVSLVNTSATFIDELVLVNVDSEEEVRRYTGETAINEGTKTIAITYNLPCEVDEGNYIIRSITEYEIRGVSKQTAWTSPVFEVVIDETSN